MSQQIYAIANCRVSSDEQLLNNSLARQQESVEKAAARLGVNIVRTWSGSVSSKAGTNVNRADLREMLEYCKDNKRVRFLIVDEYDRFMRSVNEGPYFEVLFQQLGVKVWYASETDAFNGDDAMAKFMRSMSAFRAEGSNEERQKKSISGQSKALRDGRYTFSPKPGYKKGYERGIQEIHPVRGPALRTVLIRLASRLVTPAQALIELNNSTFMQGHSPYKMDKFRKIVTDPFYAGIVEINKQVKVRNENGLHEPLISKEQHLELLKIMNGKNKNQSGPRKNGNPKYPCNNIVTCEICESHKIGRFVGFDHSNGKPNGPIYEKYRCRACNRYMKRDELHHEIKRHFRQNPINKEGVNDVLAALDVVWRQHEEQDQQEKVRLHHKVNSLQEQIAQQVEAATDPANASIRGEIHAAIARKKDEIGELENKLEEWDAKKEADKDTFLVFAYDFVKNMGEHFLDEDLSQENRLRCKQIVFPAGFYVDANKKVYTPEISVLIRLATNKKDAEASLNSHLVRVKRL